MYVAILDDHRMIADLLKATIVSDSLFKVVKIYTKSLDFLESLAINPPDVLITDISMPDIKGTGIIEKCREKYQKDKMKIIVLSQNTDALTIKTCIKLGANAYLAKGSSLKELLYAIKYVFVNEEPYLGTYLKEILVKDYFVEPEPVFNLSPREKQLLQQLCKGHTVKEIAYDLQLSLNTIHSYLRQLMKKMNVNRTPELILKAIKYSLVDAKL
ncbi:response regulator [Pedobacter punctiformis]|uniref:Response regulator transcription factor n=1 Tax=Pedobacter punctiformis TaxID=3004097 RepID=A0ABT4LD84_9SPHI|nr:response regulator transcription factor [Pedobacter sp. HCMS5-2]MCZ4245854.1 response regulator transcription factor [Pedobacter sp. HCMS5-2]